MLRSFFVCTRPRTLSHLRFYSTASAKVFIAAGKRTPFAKFGESLKDITPNDLAVASAKATLDQVKVDPKEIDHVVYANVVPSTPDTIYGARHVALKLGAKIETPGYNVNRLCGSGIQAIVDSMHIIKRGEGECVLATGVENMSMIPHATYGTRFGSRLESFKVVDFLMDSLTDQYCKTPMAITAENLAEKYKISRESADQFSLSSHQKAAKAFRENILQDLLVEIPIKKGTLTVDEHVRHSATLEEMTKLRSVFKKDGVVTAATASGIVDGAASVLVCSERFIQKHGINPLAEIIDWAVVGVEPTLMGIGPVPAIRKLLSKTGLKLSDIDLFEINEAFAAQVLAVVQELGLDTSRLNIWGGATAIGHPLGATGIRLAHTLAHQLKAHNKKLGIASACIGGGQGIALLIKAT